MELSGEPWRANLQSSERPSQQRWAASLTVAGVLPPALALGQIDAACPLGTPCASRGCALSARSSPLLDVLGVDLLGC